MIWKKEHIAESAKHATTYLRDLIDQSTSLTASPLFDEKLRIGIIGGGPKGFYALERLFAQVHTHTATSPAQVYWFNESTDFGSGPNYQVDQPDYLLINYCIGNIDAWNREEVNPSVAEQLNLTDWIQKHKLGAAHVAPTDYASRALVGCYLQDQLHLLLKTKPTSVSLHFVVDHVADVRYEDGFEIRIGERSNFIPVDQLLLATGHCYSNKPPVKNMSEQQAPAANYFGSAYPIRKLDAIPANDSVGLVGLGLTFIDAVLQLTEGRGGRFTEHGSYIPSGAEPHIYAFSRNNIPILPRGPIYGGNHYQLREQTTVFFKQLANTASWRKIDFETEIYPVLRDEAQFAYYSTLLNTADEEAIRKHTHALNEEQRFHLEDLLFPKHIPAQDGMHPVVSFVEGCIAQAEMGELKSPLLAASAVWRESTALVGAIYAHGGLTGESQKMLDEHLWGAFCRTSFGPPVENMKKIVALAKAGIVHFTTVPLKAIHYHAADQHFVLTSEHTQQTLRFLVDARIARGKLQHANAPLYTALLKNKLIQPFENENYQPGGPALDKTGRAERASESTSRPLFFYGTATEGVLLDNDSLSRKRNDTASLWSKSVVEHLLHKQKNNKHEIYSGG